MATMATMTWSQDSKPEEKPVDKPLVEKVQPPVPAVKKTLSVKPAKVIPKPTVTKAVAKPVTKSVAKPVTKAVTKAVAKPVTKAVTKAVTKPIAKPIAKVEVKPKPKDFQKSYASFVVLTPPNSSVLFADTMVMSGTAPKMHLVEVRGHQSLVDSNGNWTVKLPTPKSPGRYAFTVKLIKEAIVVDEIRWQIEKMDQDLAYSLDSLSQIKALNSSDADRTSKGDLVYFIPQTNDLSFLGMSSWRDAQIEHAHGMKIKYVHPDTMLLPTVLGTQRECTEINCASLFSSFNNVSHAVMGRVIRSDREYLVELQVLRVQDQSIVKVFRKKVAKNKTLAVDALDQLGTDLHLWVKRVLSPQIIPPEGLKKIQERDRIMKRQREIAAINGTHLKGTDLPDTLYKAKSPYVISQSMVVPAGKIVRVEAGVTFLIYGKTTEIQVFGQIDVQGSVTDPVRFVSSKANSEVGDWAGIVVQSPYTSHFNYVEFQHSKNGVEVINSSAEFNRATFKRNHFQAIRAINSDVKLMNSQIRGGHQTGIYSESYSQVKIENTKITENVYGVTINEYGSVESKRSDIYRNDYGVVLLDSVSAKFVNTTVRDNRIGFASTTHFKKLKTEDGLLSFKTTGYSGVNSNVDNYVHLSKEQLLHITGKLSGKNKSKLLLSKNRLAAYKGELISVDSESAEFQFSHMGNLSAGLAYHNVDQGYNETDRVQDFNGDTISPGSQYPNDKQIEGFEVLGSVYTLTELDSHSIEMSLDGIYDDSTGLFTKPTTLRYDSPDRSLVLGDMNESSHDLILSSRDVMGVKYVENGSKNQAGQDKWRTTVLWGESSRPLDEGEHNPEYFFDEAWPDNARAQEILVMGKLAYQKSPNLRMDYGLVHTQEKRDDLLFYRNDLKTESILAEPLVQAQAAFTEWDYTTSNQAFRLNVALVHGSSDSLEIARDLAIDQFIEENNIVELADYLKEELKRVPNPNVALISDYLPNEYVGNAWAAMAEVDQNEASIRDSLDKLTFYGFRKSSQSWGGQTIMEINLGRTNIYGRAQFMGTTFYSPGSPNLNNNSRVYELSWSQGVTNWWESVVNYGAYVENASGAEQHMNLLGYGEGTALGFTKDETQFDDLDQDRLRPKFTQNVSVEEYFFLPHDIELELYYSFNQERQQTNRVLEKDTSLNAGVFLDSYFKGTDRTLTHYGEEVGVDTQKWNDFIGLSDTLATNFVDEYHNHSVGTYVRWKYNRKSSVRLGGTYSMATDYSFFRSDSSPDDLKLTNATWAKLGYYYSGNDYTQLELPLTWTGHFDLWKNRTTVKYLTKSYEIDNEVLNEYSLNNSLSFDAIPQSVNVSLDFGVRSKKTEYDTDLFYFIDTTITDAKKLRYYEEVYALDGTLVNSPLEDDSRWAQDVHSTAETTSEYELRKEKGTKVREELDYYLGSTIKYNINSKFYTEGFVRFDSFGRPQDLNEEFTDLYTGARVNYSF